jgi:hypothetical protein
MKTNFKILLGIASLALLTTSCQDDFLDQGPTGAIINANQLANAIELNPKLGEATVTGIYATMFTTGTGGTSSQQDFGQKGYDVYGDMLSSDMALVTSTYGWYRARIHEMQAPNDFSQLENYQVWRYYYRIINLSNLVIESLGGNEFTPITDANKHTIGQAFAMRAHAYFYLSQFMINDVEASWTKPTLPIYTEPGFVGASKSTTQEVFTLMESDLNKAISFLDGFSRSTKTQVDQAVAQTMLAYVLGARRDRWADVATLAAAAIANTSASPMTTDNTINGILGGFNDVGSQGWMWGVDLNADTGIGLVSWWGQIDAFSYSYAAVGDNKGMDSGLYTSMRTDDVRRGQFFTNTASPRYLQPLFKFYDSDRVIFGTSQIVKADYIYMRYEEPLLLRIEGLARSGQEASAKVALLDFVSTRVTDASYINGLNGQPLLEEIYKQTRLEFWGEGKSYLAMKRNRATVTRGANHLSFAGQSFAFDSESLTFEIPEQEIQDNLNIKDQN